MDPPVTKWKRIRKARGCIRCAILGTGREEGSPIATRIVFGGGFEIRPGLAGAAGGPVWKGSQECGDGCGLYEVKEWEDGE